MLPYTHAGAPSHLGEATALLTLKIGASIFKYNMNLKWGDLSKCWRLDVGCWMLVNAKRDCLLNSLFGVWVKSGGVGHCLNIS